VEKTNHRPIRYRRLLGEKERALLLERVQALGRNATEAFDGDYFALDLYLARPKAHAASLPIGELPFE
jgi:tartrate dehydratase alpha subunit/fumarate hydratase class I-like protein